MPKAYILVGIPGSGKTTWVSQQSWHKDCAFISTDKWVYHFAVEQNKTYTEVFDDVMPTCVDLMVQDVINAREKGQDIIWDQTSTTVASRKKKFNMLPDYEHIAVVFRIPGQEELKQRLDRPGKEIPDSVVQSMIDNFEMPTIEEGFTKVIRVGRKNGSPETTQPF